VSCLQLAVLVAVIASYLQSESREWHPSCRPRRTYNLLLLCYFQSKNWYELVSDLKSDGPFEWRGGRNKCTKGILLLSKPIPIEVPNYGEVCTPYCFQLLTSYYDINTQVTLYGNHDVILSNHNKYFSDFGQPM